VWLYLVVQDFVLFLHTCHKCILRDIVRSTAILLVCALDLVFERLDILREEAVELEGRSLLFRERGAFIKVWVSEERITL